MATDRATQQMFKDHLSIVDLQKVRDADRLDENAQSIVDLETLMHSLHARLGNLELCVERLRLKKWAHCRSEALRENLLARSATACTHASPAFL